MDREKKVKEAISQAAGNVQLEEMDISLNDVFKYNYGSFILEVTDDVNDGKVLGSTTEKYALALGDESVCVCELEKDYEDKKDDFYCDNEEKKC